MCTWYSGEELRQSSNDSGATVVCASDAVLRQERGGGRHEGGVVSGPRAQHRVHEGDHVHVLVRPEDLAQVVDRLLPLRWGGFARRQGTGMGAGPDAGDARRRRGDERDDPARRPARKAGARGGRAAQRRARQSARLGAPGGA